MSEIIIERAIDREVGYLYFIDGVGNVCRTKLNRGRVKGAINKRKKYKEVK